MFLQHSGDVLLSKHLVGVCFGLLMCERECVQGRVVTGLNYAVVTSLESLNNLRGTINKLLE